MAPVVVHLTDIGYFLEPKPLSKLNALFSIHSTLSPSLIAGATGCSYRDATMVLFTLYGLNLANGFLEIYDKEHLDVRLARRTFEEGLPSLPFSYRHKDHTYKVTRLSQLLVGMVFELIPALIQFNSLAKVSGK